ncbi:MAG: R2-like ligand-binding oxidase [Ardenticatenaceae bacterium]|nr:R2-like ligand-binding oxidase [Ardenticatenaceae bacterium]
MIHEQFTTTTTGLDRQHPAMRLWEKGKRYGIWNPADIDLTQDKADWQKLASDEQDIILRLTALFQAGEEAVTLDLLPLINTIANEGRLEEEIYLTSFLFEEAKHTDFFDRFLREVAGVSGGLAHYHTPNYHTLFYEALPQALRQLRATPTPAAQVRASVTYNMVVEGMLAETGYHAFFTMLEANNLMPGCRQGIRLLKQDESRHIAYGIFLLSRLIAGDDTLWAEVEATIDELFLPALGVISDGLAAYDPPPFGLQEEAFIDYATAQFQKRIERLEKARGASLSEVYRVTHGVIERDDA